MTALLPACPAKVADCLRFPVRSTRPGPPTSGVVLTSQLVRIMLWRCARPGGKVPAAGRDGTPRASAGTELPGLPVRPRRAVVARGAPARAGLAAGRPGRHDPAGPASPRAGRPDTWS